MPDYLRDYPIRFYSYNKDKVAFYTRRIQSHTWDTGFDSFAIKAAAEISTHLRVGSLFHATVKGFNFAKTRTDGEDHVPFYFFKLTAVSPEPRTKITTAIGAELCDIHVHVQICISLFFSLSIFVYLSLRSDINCLLPNLIRNFRRRDNLTSFLFSLTRSEPLLYGGLVPRIFLSVGRVCERTSERASGHVRLYLFNLYRCVVRT